MEPDPSPDPDIEYAIEIRGLTKRYESLKALDDVTFSIPKGVIAGFVGPNGCGKTTTMRTLATLLKQDSGVAKVFGHDTRSALAQHKVRHAIGFMPDYFGLYTDMTAGEYLEFFAAAYRIPGGKRRSLVDDILALVNLEEKKDTLIAGLSRGMQQRLTLGRCLIHSPDLLLLDEPASGLDPRARIELMELLKELKAMGKTIFISSHILSELGNLCDMVVIMEAGKLVFVGPMEEASSTVLKGRAFMELTVESDIDTAVTLLTDLTGVLGVRTQNNQLFVEHEDSVQGYDIIRACMDNNIILQSAKRGEANLEEIFMHLTNQDN